ncbi:MAG: hypothetical protein J7497_07275 [Chitinophagaceae bacterium]|nr:hypothetical protein [Chitinophagaceae bacterium]
MTNESKNRSIIVTLILLIVVAALYRVIPGRTMGFSPHLAMALFAGAVVKDKKWAFALPIFSIFLSDLLYHSMYLMGKSEMPGFYAGQITNYILLAAMTSIGFLMKKINIVNIIAFSLLVCTAFFFLSNFFVWQSGAGYIRPKTFDGLMQCYADGVPFFVNSIKGTLIFAAVLFGAYKLIPARFVAFVNK